MSDSVGKNSLNGYGAFFESAFKFGLQKVEFLFLEIYENTSVHNLNSLACFQSHTYIIQEGATGRKHTSLDRRLSISSSNNVYGVICRMVNSMNQRDVFSVGLVTRKMILIRIFHGSASLVKQKQ